MLNDFLLYFLILRHLHGGFFRKTEDFCLQVSFVLFTFAAEQLCGTNRYPQKKSKTNTNFFIT